MGVNLLGELVANNGTYFLASGYIDNCEIDQVIVRGTGIAGIALYVTRNGELVDVTYQYMNRYSNQQILIDGTRFVPQNDEVFTQVEIKDTIGTGGLELVLAKPFY